MDPMSIIVAVDEVGGFGKDGKIPWNSKEDLKHFKDVTTGHSCVMGRKTYEDLLANHTKNKDEIKDILPKRRSYVITSDAEFQAPGATVVSSLREAVQSCGEHERVFVLGGERLFIEALSWADTIHMTIMDGDYQCDRFFPVQALKKFNIIEGKQGDGLKFVTYRRARR